MANNEPYDYSEFSEFNRFQNIDGIEWKVIDHLVKSKSKHADLLWKILKYDTLDALSKPSVPENERRELVCTDNGDQTTKRLFMSPIMDDALTQQCSFVRIYVEDIFPIDHLKATVGVTVEAITHQKVSLVTGDGDPFLNPKANPNDYAADDQSSIVVWYKNRLTVLLKCILAELNGLYLDGIGYLQLNDKLQWYNDNNTPNSGKSFDGGYLRYDSFSEAFYRYRVTFGMVMAGMSSNSDIGY